MTMHAVIENVSRRRFLDVGGHRRRASSSPCSSSRSAARFAYATGAGEMPHGDGQRSARLRLDRRGRHGHHRPPPLGDGHRRPHQPADGPRRRDGGRLGAGEARPGPRRRAQVRQPGHRRLAQRAPLHPADAPVRRRHAPDAGAGGGQAVGRAGRPRSRPSTTRSSTRPRASKLGYGELAKAAMDLPTPPLEQLKLKDAAAFRYIGKGNVPDLRPARHHHRQGRLRPGRRAAGHEVSRWSPTRRWSAARSSRSTPAAALKVPGVEKVIEIPGSGAAGQVRAAGRRRRGRQQHLGRDQGPRGAQDRVGRRPERVLRHRPPSRRRWRRPRASRARSSATRATPTRRWPRAAKVVTAEYYQPHMAHAPMEPPVGHGHRRRRQVRGLGPGAEPLRHPRGRWPRRSACRSRT